MDWLVAVVVAVAVAVGVGVGVAVVVAVGVGVFMIIHQHPMRHPSDGRIHFSELKEHRNSPAHVKAACESSREITRPMRVGYVTDRLVFDGPYPLSHDVDGLGFRIWDAERRGNAWKDFAASNAGTCIVTRSEYLDAIASARAVRSSLLAMSLIDGAEVQRVAQWTAHGLPCASGIEGERGGFDIIQSSPRGRRPYIADLKCTASSQPDELSRQCWRMLWHAQGAWYLDGAKALGMPAEDFYIIAVESSPPYCVTVARVPPELLEMGRRSVAMWAEKHRACEESGVWPGYTQAEVELTVPGWVTLEELS